MTKTIKEKLGLRTDVETGPPLTRTQYIIRGLALTAIFPTFIYGPDAIQAVQDGAKYVHNGIESIREDWMTEDSGNF